MLNFRPAAPKARLIKALALAIAGSGLLMSGCIGYKPGGNMASDDTFTYWSTPHTPTTVTLVDTRTGERFWTYEIPVGKELVCKFYTDTNPGTQFPDTMRWEILDVGDNFGELHNLMAVPDKFARRVDWEVRPSPEAAPAAAAGTTK